MLKKLFISLSFVMVTSVSAQQIAVSQFNAGSHQSAQATYIVGEAFNNYYQFADGSLAESILGGAASSVLAVSNQAKQFTKVYPNPVTHQRFFVESPVSTNGYLYTISGRLLRTVELKRGKNTVDISTLSSGLYLLKTESGFMSKIIIP